MTGPRSRRRLAGRVAVLLVLCVLAYTAPLFMLAVTVLALTLGAYALTRHG